MGPLILASLGLGTLGASFLTKLAPFRPVFGVIAGLSLLYVHDRRAKGKMSTKYKGPIWIITILAVLFLLSPMIFAVFSLLSN